MTSPGEVKGGLEGVVAGRTALSTVNAEEGRLYYRGYDIVELAENASFEEVAWLLLDGELPGRKALRAFARELARARKLPSALTRFLAFPAAAHPMDMLRTAVSALGTIEAPTAPNAPESLREHAVRLIARTPTIVAKTWRKAQGQAPPPATGRAGFAGSFLWMITGREPDDAEARAFDATLILYAEHSFNASTFAGRVTVSTLSDVYAGVTSAIGALKGPLHGGANEKAMEMLTAIGEPAKAREHVLRALAEKKKIMGFGHRVYKKKDSRHPTVKRLAQELCRKKGEMRWFETAEIVENTMMQEKGIFPNLDFYSSVVYYLLGIPIPLYTPIFAASRMSGWCAHLLEQLGDNRLIRPLAEYTGPPPRPFVPLSER